MMKDPPSSQRGNTLRQTDRSEVCVGMDESCFMFDLQQFTADCRAALCADRSNRQVGDVVASQSLIRQAC